VTDLDDLLARALAASLERADKGPMREVDVLLSRAVAGNDVEVARDALRQGANPNNAVRDIGDIHDCAKPAISGCRSVAMLSLLLDAGGDPNGADVHGDLLGHRLLRFKQIRDQVELVPMFKALVDAGYEITASGSDRHQVIHWLMDTERAQKLLPLLLEAGVDINARDGNGETLLHKAALSGNLELARVAISNGADINIANEAGFTPIEFPLHEGNMEEEDAMNFANTIQALWQFTRLRQRTNEVGDVQGERCSRCGKTGAHSCRL
jgi:ankyrin repeat protein